MKHLLNNLSKEEKNRILEQHSGGIKIMTENFSRLINSKLGNIKPIILETESKALKKRDCDWYVTESRLVDNTIGELQLSNINGTTWEVKKLSNPNNDKVFTLLEIEIPEYKDLQVIWNKKEKRIELYGEKSKMALKAYNTLNKTTYGPESCKVVYTSEGSVDSKYGIQSPNFVSMGELYLNKVSIDVPGSEPVKLKDGAFINIDSNFYKTRKSNFKVLFKNSIHFNISACRKY